MHSISMTTKGELREKKRRNQRKMRVHGARVRQLLKKEDRKTA